MTTGKRSSNPKRGRKHMTDGVSDALRKKAVAWRKRWKRIVDEAKAANLETGRQKKDSLEGILAEAERAGIERKAFKLVMKKCDHLDNAEGVRNDIEEDAILATFDKMQLALELPGLEAEPEEKTDKKSRRKAEDDDTNVTRLRTAEAAGAA